MIKFLALLLCILFLSGCSENTDATPTELTTPGAGVTVATDSTAATEAEPSVFDPWSEVKEYVDFSASMGGVEIGNTGDSRYYLDANDDYTNGSSYVYNLSIPTYKSYGLPDNPNLVEYPVMDFEVKLGEKILTTREDYVSAASMQWDISEKWLDYGLTDDDRRVYSQAYSQAFDAFVEEFCQTYQDYKIVSCAVNVDGGLYTETAICPDGTWMMNVHFNLLIVDEYTGAVYSPAGNTMYLEDTVSVNENTYDVGMYHTVYVENYLTIPKEELPENHLEWANYEGCRALFTFSVLVPAEYDGIKFLLGPGDAETDKMITESGKYIFELSEFQLHESDNYYFSYERMKEIKEKRIKLYGLMENAPDYDENVKTGEPGTEGMELVSPNGIALKSAFVWKNQEDGYLKIDFANPESNNVLVALYFYDEPTAELLGSSGLIRPGEYLERVKLDGMDENMTVECSICLYDIDTHAKVDQFYLDLSLFK